MLSSVSFQTDNFPYSGLRYPKSLGQLLHIKFIRIIKTANLLGCFVGHSILHNILSGIKGLLVTNRRTFSLLSGTTSSYTIRPSMLAPSRPIPATPNFHPTHVRRLHE